MYSKQYFGYNDENKLVQFLKIFNFNVNLKIIDNTYIYKEKNMLGITIFSFVKLKHNYNFVWWIG